MRNRFHSAVALLTASMLWAARAEINCEERLAKFHPKPAPASEVLLLKKGDRLAIIGDSITEQKMYSRIMETYLTTAHPDLDITVRQFGWSGEQAPGFLNRMTNDCLRFQPTIATTCYGMNDHGYRRYEPGIGDRYRESSTAIVRSFKAHGVRVVQGSPGCVGKVPGWTKSETNTKDDLNLNLLELRNIGIEIAQSEHVGFADVFWPMLTQDCAASQKYGADYAVPGKDGVHPNWAGQTVMAYAFLKALGVDGDLGTISVDLQSHQATAGKGHEVVGCDGGEVKIKSSRYPFCAAGDATKDDQIRSGMELVPFNQELNRLTFKVKNAPGARCKVTWGPESHSYTREQLGAGINLAADFQTNPFSAAFAKVDEAVAKKQNYETRQIKTLFHGEEGQADPEATVALTEKVRAPLAAAIKSAFTPVTHTIVVTAE